MDRVRFGRALGMGTRDAGRALLKAADAAMAPDPAAPITSAPRPRPAAPQAVAQAAQKIQATRHGVKAGSKRFGEAMWGPVVKVSGIVWLEVTGVLFSLFAIAAAMEIWRRRADFHATGEPRRNLYIAIGMLLVFGWFTVSSFLRARRRAQR
jgi:hypothetical protein